MDDALLAGAGRHELVGEGDGVAVGGQGVGVAQPPVPFLPFESLDQIPRRSVGAEPEDLDGPLLLVVPKVRVRFLVDAPLGAVHLGRRDERPAVLAQLEPRHEVLVAHAEKVVLVPDDGALGVVVVDDLVVERVGIAVVRGDRPDLVEVNVAVKTAVAVCSSGSCRGRRRST